jgi:membrane associated rhomboid family serine protease
MFFDLIWCITGFTLKQLLVGASTSICAVMGLFIAQVIVLHKMGESAKKGKCIAGVLIVSLTLVSLQPHVSLLAHLGGLLSGLFFGLMVLPGSQQEAVKKLKTMGTMIFIGFSVILLVFGCDQCLFVDIF